MNARRFQPLLAASLLVLVSCHKDEETDGEGDVGTQAAVGFLSISGHVEHMQAGFEEVSSDWDSFAATWAFADPVSFDALENEALILYSTEPELREVYRFRADLYEKLADDTTRNAACGVQPTLSDIVRVLDELRTEAGMRQVGRGLARHHEGYQAWRLPTVDQEVRDAFSAYLRDKDMSQITALRDKLSKGETVSNEHACRAQAALYRAAADRPHDQVGDLHLFDYVRSLEASSSAPSTRDTLPQP